MNIRARSHGAMAHPIQPDDDGLRFFAGLAFAVFVEAVVFIALLIVVPALLYVLAS